MICDSVVHGWSPQPLGPARQQQQVGPVPSRGRSTSTTPCRPPCPSLLVFAATRFIFTATHARVKRKCCNCENDFDGNFTKILPILAALRARNCASAHKLCPARPRGSRAKLGVAGTTPEAVRNEPPPLRPVLAVPPPPVRLRPDPLPAAVEERLGFFRVSRPRKRSPGSLGPSVRNTSVDRTDAKSCGRPVNRIERVPRPRLGGAMRILAPEDSEEDPPPNVNAILHGLRRNTRTSACRSCRNPGRRPGTGR